MNILNAQGLIIQGTGAGNLNYGVRQLSKTVTFTYAAGLTNILTITAPSAPTDYTISFFYTYNAENFTNNSFGPQTFYGFKAYKMLSSGFWSEIDTAIYVGQGNAWQSQSFDIATSRTLKMQSQGNNASNTSLSCTYQLMISSRDFSYLTFS
jgi:hypothetical protein